MIARAAIVAVALVAAAWLAIQWRDAHLIARGADALDRQVYTKSVVAPAIRDTKDGGLLNPDRAEPLTYISALQAGSRDIPAARRSLERLVAVDPDNPEAWFLLSEITRTSDPALSARARARVNALDPRNAGRAPGG